MCVDCMLSLFTLGYSCIPGSPSRTRLLTLARSVEQLTADTTSSLSLVCHLSPPSTTRSFFHFSFCVSVLVSEVSQKSWLRRERIDNFLLVFVCFSLRSVFSWNIIPKSTALGCYSIFSAWKAFLFAKLWNCLKFSGSTSSFIESSYSRLPYLFKSHSCPQTLLLLLFKERCAFVKSLSEYERVQPSVFKAICIGS